VLYVKPPPAGHWVGDGFAVKTYFSYAEDAQALSPFLLLDYGPPRAFAPTTERLGVGPHPHRGFETVTVAYQGEVEHRDSAGHAGRIGPGDVQWMTAGAGVLHEELHGRELGRTGGTLEMAQVWVNLPRAHKRTAPRYQDLRSRDFPSVELPGGAGAVRVIAGEHGGARGPAHTFSPVTMLDVTLRPGAAFDLDLPEGHTVLLLVRRGGIRVNGAESAPERHLVALSREGVRVHLDADSSSEVLVLAGAPLGEPVAGHGPFVMNTWEEIHEAIDDYGRGAFGHLEATQP
jgi:redox-sensitive bicupin YhaK (pirin superfamily)